MERRKRGRPPYGPEERLLLAEVGDKFRKAIEQRSWTVWQAAADLGVSRSAMYKYLAKASLPGPVVLHRAVELWKLQFDNLPAMIRTRRRQAFDQRQLSFAFIEALRQQDIQIELGEKKPGSVEILLTVRFAGHK